MARESTWAVSYHRPQGGLRYSEGIAGFTLLAELFIGRTAMGGFATGIAQEFITGDGILAQLGVRDLPNEQIFDFSPPPSPSTGRTIFRQLVAGEMSPKQFKRYQKFLGLTAKDEAARLNATREAQEKEIDGGIRHRAPALPRRHRRTGPP